MQLEFESHLSLVFQPNCSIDKLHTFHSHSQKINTKCKNLTMILPRISFGPRAEQKWPENIQLKQKQTEHKITGRKVWLRY